MHVCVCTFWWVGGCVHVCAHISVGGRVRTCLSVDMHLFMQAAAAQLLPVTMCCGFCAGRQQQQQHDHPSAAVGARAHR